MCTLVTALHKEPRQVQPLSSAISTFKNEHLIVKLSVIMTRVSK